MSWNLSNLSNLECLFLFQRKLYNLHYLFYKLTLVVTKCITELLWEVDLTKKYIRQMFLTRKCKLLFVKWAIFYEYWEKFGNVQYHSQFPTVARFQFSLKMSTSCTEITPYSVQNKFVSYHKRTRRNLKTFRRLILPVRWCCIGGLGAYMFPWAWKNRIDDFWSWTIQSAAKVHSPEYLINVVRNQIILA